MTTMQSTTPFTSTVATPNNGFTDGATTMAISATTTSTAVDASTMTVSPALTSADPAAWTSLTGSTSAFSVIGS